jgi:hypothetical protein
MDWIGGIRLIRARGVTSSLVASAALLCLLWLPIHGREIRLFRRAAAAELLEQLLQAVRSYQLDWGACPPGDGDGSGNLAAALARASERRPCGFLEPAPEAPPAGSIANPIHLDAPWPLGVVHYRRNPPGSRPAVELWVHDRAGPTIRVACPR